MSIVRTTALRIGFWGTRTLFSDRVLTELVKRNAVNPYIIEHVAVPASRAQTAAVAVWSPAAAPSPTTDELLVVNPAIEVNPLQTAWQYGIPTFQVRQLRLPAVTTWLADRSLDVVCVACFPWRIPAVLLAVPTYGFLNLHPSCLPAYRGPTPLFWQLRDGLREIGVTVHWMDAAFDSGAIAAQGSVTLPDGATSAAADRLCAESGATLLVGVLNHLGQRFQARQPQPVGGSQQPWPTAADFQLSPQWSAQHAYNFMCGTTEWWQAYRITLDGETLLLRRALGYDLDQQLDRPFIRNQQEAWIRFQPGVLHALTMDDGRWTMDDG
jgi:methionyl-tRNA formyltransferase